jgi:hypothetical protein
MKTKAPLTILVLFAVLASTMTFAAPPGKDTMSVTAGTSANGVSPIVHGNNNEWFYAYCLPSGSVLSDSYPIKFVVTDTNNNPGDQYTISLKAVGSPQLVNGTTLPGDFSITDDGVSQTKTVSVNTAVLPDGQYNLNIQITADPPGRLTTDHDTIHIQVTVGGVCGGAGATCYFTDSDFNFLLDCSGNDVTTNTGGTFQIVANAKGKVVATNPGQFYYNLIWTNSGATRPITVTLAETGLNTMGANSVHALTFNATGFTQDVGAFDMVNQDGTPCGPSGPCTITVNSGDVLWVTWHLEFAGIGGNINVYSNSCPGNAAGSVTASGTLSDSSGVITSCGAAANGYAKK